MSQTDIIARLVLNGERFTAEARTRFEGLEAQARATSAKIGSAFSTVGKVAGLFGASLGIAELAGAATRALDYASSLGEVAQQLGVTTKDLQVYRYAATQVGIEQDEIDKGLAKLTQTLGQAAVGAKKPEAAFDALGISVRDTSGHVKTAGQVIPEIAAALKGVTDPAQRAAVEIALFGKTGQKLDTLLSGGRGQIDNLREAAERLGLVLSDRQIQNADDAADKLAAVKQVLEARIAGVVADNAESIVGLANSLEVLVGKAERAGAAWVAFKNSTAGQFLGFVNQGASWLNPVAVSTKMFGRAVGQAEPNRGSDPASLAKTRAAIFAGDPLADFRKGIDIKPFLDASDGKSKSSRSGGGKSDAERQAEQAKKDGDRLQDQLDRYIAGQREEIKLGEMRADGLEREADVQEAISRAEDQFRDIVGLSVAEIEKKYGRTKDQAVAMQEQLRIAKELAATEAGGAFDDRALEEGARNAQKVARKANDELQKAYDEQQRMQEDQIRGLADFYQSAFEGGSGSVWKDFKEQGKRVIAEMAALYTLQMLSGQKTSSLTSLMGMVPSAQGGLLGAFSGAAGLIGSASSLFGGASAGAGLAASGGAMRALTSGSAGAGAASGLLGAASTAAPYLAIASFALPLISGLFKKTKKGSATLGFTDGDLGVVSTAGNSSSRKASASSAGGSVADALRQIAEQLGGDLDGPISTSIGIRKKSYRVDTTGAGRTKGAGVLDFGSDQQAAQEAAIRDALSDGVLKGISAASQKILASGQDLDKAITKALSIEHIPKLLKQRNDPLGAAMDDLNDQFATLIKTLNEGGASAEQFAQAQQLYALELEDVKTNTKGAASSLKEFLAGMKAGSNSPYSLRQQEESALASLKPYFDKIDAGGAIDQDAYLAAAQIYLDVERQLNGSTQGYFEALDRVQAETNKAIARIDNAQPIRTFADPFAEATAKATQASAEIQAQHTQQLQGIRADLGTVTTAINSLAAGWSFVGGARSFR